MVRLSVAALALAACVASVGCGGSARIAGDNDADGLVGRQDWCPNQAEDKDGFRDDDGCPDADNDGDGVADAADRCAMAAEDRDGFEDGDGCPDPDDDHDGVADGADRCPRQPEDRDNFEDSDGCPDADNDGDGIADASDKCPSDAESFDGAADTDGCPEGGRALVALTPAGIELRETIRFASDGVVLAAESEPVLRQLAGLLRQQAPLRVRVEVELDVGTDERSLTVSNQRAAAIRAKLIDLGVPADRVEAKGRGNWGATASGARHQRFERVAIIVIKEGT